MQGYRLVAGHGVEAQMAEDLYRLVEAARLRPVVDRVFPFAQVRQAYQHLAGGLHFGKVVIRVGD
jgi:NADPH:quinone reductase-like Zn-dependent oxidoreductase